MRRILLFAGFMLLLGIRPVLAADPAVNQVRQAAEALGEQTVASSLPADPEQRRLLRERGAGWFDFPSIAHAMMNQAGVNVPAGRESEVIEGVAIYVMREVGVQLEKIRPRRADVGEIELKGPTQAQVQLTLSGIDQQLKADWQLIKGNNSWRVTDILVGGRSLVSRLAGKLKDHAGNFDRLNAFLRNAGG